MPVPAQVPVSSSTANGVTTVFPYDFKIAKASDLEVTDNGVVVTGYTVSGVGDDAGGSITFSVAPANGHTIIRRRVMEYERTDFDYQENGDLTAETLDGDMDAQVMMIQQLSEEVGRAFKLPVGSPPVEIPSLDPLRYWRNRADGLGVDFVDLSAGDSSLALAAALADPSGSSLVGFVQAGSGAVTRTAQDKMRDSVCLLDYSGADPGGVADSTQALVNAVALGRDVDLGVGEFKITDGISPSVVGQVIKGRGKELTKIIIPASFNLSASGVFSPSAHSCEFHDFSIEFEQPDTAVRANLTAYPPAFKLTGIPGTVVSGVRVVAAKTVFDMTGNTGQTRITDSIISFFDYGAKLDGALDSVRFEGVHFWPVGLTANQTAIMVENTTIGMSIGRADDLKGHGCLFYCGTPIDAFTGGSGGCFATFDNCDLDGFRGLVISGGTISFVGGFQSSGNVSAKKLIQTGGIVNYSGVDFLISANFATSPDPWMSVASGRCSFTGCTVVRANFDVCLFNVGPTGTLNFGNNSIQHDQNIAYSYPFIYAQNGSRVNAGHNTLSDVGSGSAVFFQNVGDGLHNVCDNTLIGHTMSVSGSQGVFKDNGTASNLSGSVVIGSVQTLYFAGSLSGGTATVPHGVIGLQTKVIRADAFQKGGSGEAAPITVSAIDGTNVYLVGGSGTQRYRLTVEYIMTDQSPW